MIRIAHIADVHIRGLSRHDEYFDVFTAFIKQAKEQRVDHIFVAGDLFHTKTSGISPEYIDFMTWWLNAMSTVAEVHLILGNHDGNLVNLSRQDAVSPIVDALKNPRVHLYKKSGTYEFTPGYTWCVFSLFDEEGWSNVKPIPGKLNIACYHGPIKGAVLETNWLIDRGLTIDFFQQFDLCFLGDIHKFQFLGMKDVEYVKGSERIKAQRPWIGYPGSAIQQSYAEDLRHGWLLWEIDDRDCFDVQFHELPNPKPFVTIEWRGTIEDTLADARNHPMASRFRVRNNDVLTQKEVQQLTLLLKEQRQATEVTFKNEHQINRDVVSAGATILLKEDLRNPDVLLKLVQDYHQDSNITSNEWEAIREQVIVYLQQALIADDTVRNTKWSLKYLSFDNTFAYGEKNVINFDQLNGIVGIFGPNRVGKSSIVGTIMYALHNTTDRGSVKNLFVITLGNPTVQREPLSTSTV